MTCHLTLAGALLMSAISQAAPRPAGHPQQTRSIVMAKNGMVATSHPLAAQAGIEILQRGGNAVDAAVAANAVLGVVEPMSCGIGGDLFALVWDAKSRRLYGLNASGRSPYEATRELFRAKGMSSIPETGPLSWSVPGCVDGWNELRERFGTMEFSEILAPAIRHAEEGFPIVELIGAFWKNSEPLLLRTPDAARTYLVDGRSPPVGSLATNKPLARTYRLIAKEGSDAFYRGDVADRIVEFSRRNGGLFSHRDFAEHRSDWAAPVSTNYRGYEVWELPPNGQGVAVLQMLNILEPFDLASMGIESAEYRHLFLEAKKLAYEDRARFYADPEFEKDLPIATLIGKPYAERRRRRIDPNRAMDQIPPDDPKLAHGDTVYLTVVDKDRNAVSLIQSIYHGWGSGIAPGDLGFMLQNRGSQFSLDESHRNRLEPHKRPFHTIIPAMVLKDGLPRLCFGVMGGDMQPQGQVQVLVNILDFGMNVQLAGETARVRHSGSSTPTGEVMRDGGAVAVEGGVSAEVVEALRAKGHRVSMENSSGFGGYQAILIDWETGVLQGASDHRKDGAAIGY